MRKHVVLYVILLSGVVSFFAHRLLADKETADLYYEKGMREFKEERYDTAESAFLKALENYENHLESCLKLAELYAADPKRQESAADYYFKVYDILMEKDSLSKEDSVLLVGLENKLSQLDRIALEYKKERSFYLRKLLTLAGEAKKAGKLELGMKLYEEVLLVDQGNAAALKGSAEIEKSAGFNKNDLKQKEGDLFNGKNLSDWARGGTWDVKNGEVCGESKPQAASFIAYNGREFAGKFTITLKFKADNSAGILLGFTDESRDFFALLLEDNNVILRLYVNPVKEGDGNMKAEVKKICSADVTNAKAGDWNTLLLKINNGFASAYLNNRKCFENEKLPVSSITGKAGVIVLKGAISVKSINAVNSVKK